MRQLLAGTAAPLFANSAVRRGTRPRRSRL